MALASIVFRIVLFLLLFTGPLSNALSLQYCASFNTGADFNRVTNGFQSNGACEVTCREKYALAIVQGQSCWCSDYVPGSVTSLGDCDEKCPGYGYESCGSAAKGLYGYIALSRAPSGTLAASSPSTASTAQPSSESTSSVSPSTVTSISVVTASPSTTVSTVIITPTPSTRAETVSSPSEPSSTLTRSTSLRTTAVATTRSSLLPTTSSWSPTPIVSVQTVTGELRTVTITPTGPPNATSSTQQQNGGSSFWSEAGKVAGVFTTLGIIVLLCVGGGIFYLHRRTRKLERIAAAAIAASNPTPTGGRSLSEFGLLSESRTIMGEKAMSTHETFGKAGPGSGPDNISPVDRRNSQARVIDQRLDPTTIWNPTFDNSSRVSIRSLQDDQDYSRRVLRLANPDHSEA